MQLKKACSAAAPLGLACSHCVTHAWSAQFIVLMQSMMLPQAALAVQAAPGAQHFDV
jgi:hypothetical protein